MVSSGDYFISQWLRIILPSNEKSDSLKKLDYGARISQSSLIKLDYFHQYFETIAGVLVGFDLLA